MDAIEESSQPPAVLVAVSRGTHARLSAQIEAQLRRAIRAGSLRPGVRLPSTRALAGQLGVSRRVISGRAAQLR